MEFRLGLGDEKPLERVPQVFRARVKERRLDESAYNPDMDNYTSAELSGDQLEAHFRKEEALGRMLPSTEAAVAEEFGSGKLLISAMGAIEKANGDIRPPHMMEPTEFILTALSKSLIDWRFRGQMRFLSVWPCLKRRGRRSSGSLQTFLRPIGWFPSGSPTGRSWDAAHRPMTAWYG